MAKAARLSKAECKRRALLSADWFVNTQVAQHRPQWDANHGRVIYNYHMPSGQRVLGLSWSQGRAIMCLTSAWELSGRQRYLDAAVRCGDYLRYALQQMDRRCRRSFGGFREEVPTSRFSFPRDGIEGAFGLLLLHAATGETDYLDRCRMFADWYLKFAYVPSQRWVRGEVPFDTDRVPLRLSYIQAGGCPFFWHLHRLTGDRRYLRAVRMLADGLRDRFIDPETGAIVSARERRRQGAVNGGRPIAFNDDGASIALTCAHAAFAGRRKSSQYLAAAVTYGDWIVNDCPRPLPKFAANGMQAIFLTELAAVTGRASYTDFAHRLMAGQVKLQINAPSKLDRHGGFRGEDESPDAYVKGAAGRDFVVTRTTAYSALALFRLHGAIHGPSYSALGLRRALKARRAAR